MRFFITTWFMKKILDGSRERLLKGRKKCADIAAMDKALNYGLQERINKAMVGCVMALP
jgi:hypothetical protein